MFDWELKKKTLGIFFCCFFWFGVFTFFLITSYCNQIAWPSKDYDTLQGMCDTGISACNNFDRQFCVFEPREHVYLKCWLRIFYFNVFVLLSHFFAFASFKLGLILIPVRRSAYLLIPLLMLCWFLFSFLMQRVFVCFYLYLCEVGS